MVVRTGSHRTRDVRGVQLRPVMNQMSANEVSGGKSTDERQLSGQDGSSDNPGELLSVLSRVSGVSTFDSQQLEHSLLWSKHSATTYGSNFDARHGHGHQKVLAVIGSELMSQRAKFKQFREMTHGSIPVMQFELSTFCAGSCPVARKTAVRMLAA